MKRANIFRLRPTREQEARLFQLADNCSKMWNEVNYKRRQSFFSGRLDWNTIEFYHRYKSIIGSATAQKIIRKNNEAWKSFFSLLKKWKEGELDEKPKPPGYWKDRKTGKRKSAIVMRNDCYNKGVSEIIVGDIKNIRDSNNNGNKVNSMIHNFWSFRYITERLRTTAKNCGINVKLVEESYTSSVCPRCGSTNIFKHKRLFKCLDCRLEAHRDAVGCVNIGLAQGYEIPAEAINRAVARPLLIEA